MEIEFKELISLDCCVRKDIVDLCKLDFNILEHIEMDQFECLVVNKIYELKTMIDSTENCFLIEQLTTSINELEQLKNTFSKTLYVHNNVPINVLDFGLHSSKMFSSYLRFYALYDFRTKRLPFVNTLLLSNEMLEFVKIHQQSDYKDISIETKILSEPCLNVIEKLLKCTTPSSVDVFKYLTYINISNINTNTFYDVIAYNRQDCFDHMLMMSDKYKYNEMLISCSIVYGRMNFIKHIEAKCIDLKDCCKKYGCKDCVEQPEKTDDALLYEYIFKTCCNNSNGCDDKKCNDKRKLNNIINKNPFEYVLYLYKNGKYINNDVYSNNSLNTMLYCIEKFGYIIDENTLYGTILANNYECFMYCMEQLKDITLDYEKIHNYLHEREVYLNEKKENNYVNYEELKKIMEHCSLFIRI